MISPEAFERAHKRRVTDVIRVAVERRGVIGFIDISETMSLLDARALIRENVENAPADFQFVLEDGAPVSARQESSQKITYFYPCVKIRDSSRATASGQLSSPTDCGDNDDADDARNACSSSGATEKITVHSASGGEFSAWISDAYTFQQLRRDASRYWSLPPSQVALTDADGCLWPEQARILSVMSVEELERKKVVLEHKCGARTKHLARTQSVSLPKTASCRQQPWFKADSGGGGAASPRQTPGAAASGSSLSLSASSLRSELSPTPTPTRPVEELWLIFTYYCVTGDSLELECIKAHQFNKLLRDSKLFGGGLTPAMADIIYTSETKGKPQASGKMSYDEFLNALVKISATKHKQSSRQPLRESRDEEQLFQKLVLESILPLAARWPTHVWDVHTQRLRQPEVVSFVSKFADPLLEIFLFYARSHLVGAAGGSKEFFMSYADYQRFFNDFAFANLQLSSVDAAQVFLAACSSSPFHVALFTGGSDTTSQTPGGPALDASTASITRVLESFEGVVTYAFPEAQIGRVCMGVSAFLDALGRSGLVAFATSKTIRALHCVKAVCHHLSRGLTRSRVQEILRNHSSTSIHATKFYSGAVAFNNRFLDMWRYEGSPDYLAGSSIYSFDGSGGKDAPSAGSSREASVAAPGAAAVCLSAPLSPAASPSRRLMMTSSMFEDRVISSGAGRGREALDRLVRNAFLRNAVDAMNATDAQPLDPRLVNAHAQIRPTLAHAGAASAAAAAASPLPMRREDERALFESVLLKGGVFKKYGQWGNPHRRYVWCSKDFDAVFWRPLNRKNSLSKEGIAVAGVIAVLPGNSTRTRYAFMKHLSDEKSLCRCFSVVAEDRRLDLEADSEATRDLWVSAFLYLIKEHRPRLLVA
ncbi:hypothetical protein PybrP1_012957 [[Pythium] brassicae (nom. inval.)]|nr:hypothetical protein PybrP1_012957 [[Pythium] brassicae (nom. inval.)]